MELRVLQEAKVKGHKFAILVDDKYGKTFEAVWDEKNKRWETDFCYPSLRINSLDVAAELDFRKVKEMGYIICA